MFPPLSLSSPSDTFFCITVKYSPTSYLASVGGSGLYPISFLRISILFKYQLLFVSSFLSFFSTLFAIASRAFHFSPSCVFIDCFFLLFFFSFFPIFLSLFFPPCYIYIYIYQFPPYYSILTQLLPWKIIMFMEFWERRFNRCVHNAYCGSRPLSSSHLTPLLLLSLGCTVLLLSFFLSFLIYFPSFFSSLQKFQSFSYYPINASCFILFQKIVYAYKSPLPLIITLFSNCIILFLNLFTFSILLVKSFLTTIVLKIRFPLTSLPRTISPLMP